MPRLCLWVLFAASISLAGCSSVTSLTQPAITSTKLLSSPMLTLEGAGTQTFVCTRDSKGRYWRLVASDVKLSSPKTRRVLVRQRTDFTFVAADGSALAATVMHWESGASTGDLKTLLFKTEPRGNRGLLSAVTRVLRDNARGGQPQTLCSASQVGHRQSIPFTARYRFYRN